MNIIKIENRYKVPKTETPQCIFYGNCRVTRAKITLDVNCPASSKNKRTDSNPLMLPLQTHVDSNEERTSSTSPTSIETGCVSPIIRNRKNSAVGRGVGSPPFPTPF
ncbi:hypothetical protein CEXT_815111 [Caerostris extrusa]|uniref:Uncharacterized protein n=1 Tax=Caerostris extrusa TaxID=172846 RepID=A0AAV4R7Q3_CAEEX|nr:hypothetical protein CEXT_815111 [Caerostris extrusa]